MCALEFGVCIFVAFLLSAVIFEKGDISFCSHFVLVFLPTFFFFCCLFFPPLTMSADVNEC